MRDAFDSGDRPPMELGAVDVHSVASLLKNYLRDLPEPIMPVRLYEPVMHIVIRELGRRPDESVEKLGRELARMPPASYHLLRYLCQFLHEVSEQSAVNKMTSENLAMVLSQSIIEPEDDDPALLMGTSHNRTAAVNVMITKFDRIFASEHLSVEEDFSRVRVLAPADDLMASCVNNSTGVPSPASATPAASPRTVDQMLCGNLPDFGISNSAAGASILRHGPLLTPDIIRDAAGGATEGPSLSMYPSVGCSPATVSKHSDHVTDTIFFDTEEQFDSLPCLSKDSHHSDITALPSVTLDVFAQELTSTTDDGAALVAVLDADANSLDRDGLLELVDALRVHLRQQSHMVFDLKSHLVDSRKKLATQLNDFASKLDSERSATASAVGRIIEIQSNLNEYALKYGPLK